MKVVLLRHATRDTHALSDAPLNKTGRNQAEELSSKVRTSGALPAPHRLLASPKLRAQETLAPLAQATGKNLETEPRLDERRNSESRHDFEKRIRSLIAELNEAAEKTEALNQAQVIYLCTHFDWLEAALVLIDSDLSEKEMESGWAPCEYKIFRVKGNDPDKIWLLEGKGVITPQSERMR